MNAVDELLSDIADYTEHLLRVRPEALRELTAALEAGQRPHVLRPLGPILPRHAVTVAMGPAPG